MKCGVRILLFPLLFLWPGLVTAQDEEPDFFIQGYLKEMISVNDIGDSALVDNLIHNRLDFRWYPKTNLRFYGSLRTRLFTGETTKYLEDFEDFIEYDTYFFDLSWTVIHDDAIMLHTMIDRLYLEWIRKDLTIKAGRQRINWGINTVWNPNDIFNAYSYFDFDYEERPGTDALRIEYYTGTNSSIEAAVSLPAETMNPDGEEVSTLTAAVLYKTNRWNYDFQFLGGFSRENWVLGAGWAGNLGTASLKGEVTWFLPEHESEYDPKALVGTIGVEHTLGNFFYGVSYLYNSAGPSELGPEGLIRLNSRALTAKNLSPYRHSAFIQTSYQFHPLVSGGLGLMFFPPNKAMFFSPFATWNAGQNFDLDLIVQGFYGEDFLSGEFRALSVSYFLRAKWSF